MAAREPLRPLIVSLEYPPVLGGGSSYVDSLVSDLLSVEPGMDISVLTSGEYDEDLVYESRPSVRVFRRHAAQQALRDTVVSAGFVNDLREVMSAVEPNVAHAHHSVPIIALKGVTLHQALPSLYTQHRTPELPGTGFKLDGKGIMGEIAASLPGDGHWIAPSHFFKSRLESSGVSENDISVVWPSADFDRFSPVDQGVAKEAAQSFMPYDTSKRLVVVPIVPRPRKDAPFALEALSGTDTAVVVTGLRDGSVEDETLRRDYPNTDLIAHNRLSDEELATVMNAADVVILPSTHEGFGIAGIEALSTGVPTFLRRAPGLDEIAAELGFVQQFETTDHLRQLVQQSRSVPFEDRQRQHEVVRRTFSSHARALSHIALYRQAIERSRRSGS